MKKMFIAIIVVAGFCCTVPRAFATHNGESLFAANCKVCHPNGGNIVNPSKTLQQKDRLAHGVKTEDDIVRIMRNPGPGMTRFDEKTLSDKQARQIAEYMIKTFDK